MTPRDRDRYRQKLLERREGLLRDVAHVRAEMAGLAEQREPEFEEQAGDDRATQVLDRLDAREQVELELVEAALARLDDGRFGTCAACQKPIAVRRLTALPWTPYCRDCAEAVERGTSAGQEPEARPAPLPPDYALLTGSELEAAIREHLREDGRVDMDELRIVCRGAVVHLEGVLPSAAERQILLHTLTDVMGLANVVDRLRISEVPWEREDRTADNLAAEQKPWDQAVGSEDIVEATEDGADFVAPDRPVPDEE